MQVIRCHERPSSALAAPLERLERAALPNPWNQDQIVGQLAAPGCTVFLAEGMDDEKLGFALAIVPDGGTTGGAGKHVPGSVGAGLIPPDPAELLRIGVLPAARKRGLGRLLVEHVVTTAAAHTDRMLLEVAADNTAAIALYQSCGFAKIATRRNYYAGGVDALVFEKTWPWG